MQLQISYIYLTVLKVRAAILILTSFHFTVIKLIVYSVFDACYSLYVFVFPNQGVRWEKQRNFFSITFFLWLVRNLVEDHDTKFS